MASARPSRFIGSFGWQVLAGMVLGLALGLLARGLGAEEGEPGFALAETLRITGSSFIQLLRALVPPLVFTAIVASTRTHARRLPPSTLIPGKAWFYPILTLCGLDRPMMFEGKPPNRGDAVSLQAVSWADLSARLAAARDLRRALVEDEHGEGSFDAASARWIADHAADPGEGLPNVNPDDLANRKAVDRMASPERALTTPGDRGIE